MTQNLERSPSTLSSSTDLQTYIEDLLTIDETNSTGIFNYGRIATADELNLNSNSTIINYDDALIFSNNSMNINVKDYLINYAGATGTGLWSRYDINIAGYETDTSVETLANLGGTIESYAGDISIDGGEVINSRVSIPTQVITTYGTQGGRTSGYYYDHKVYSINGELTREATIYAGNNLTFNTLYFNNNGSEIYALNDIAINATNNFENTSYYLYAGVWEHYNCKDWYCATGGTWNTYRSEGGSWGYISERTTKTENILYHQLFKLVEM